MLKTGVIALALLVASRLVGVLRDLVIAGMYGISATADAVTLLVSLPDLVAGLLGAGALHLAWIPLWLAREPSRVADIQARVMRKMLAVGAVAAAAAVVAAPGIFALLAPGLAADSRQALVHASPLMWAAVPLAMASAVLGTRSLFGSDSVGVYGASLVLTVALIAGLVLTRSLAMDFATAVQFTAGAVLVAYAVRVVWQWYRRPPGTAPIGAVPADATIPSGFYVSLATGWIAISLPSLLPVVARSWISSGGEGLLASFNYAAKFADVGFQLGIQLVATLAVPGLAAAMASRMDFSGALRRAFALSWMLACVVASCIWAFGERIACVVFCRGAIGPAEASVIGYWMAVISLGLLFQSVTAILSVVMSNVGAWKAMGFSYGVGLVLLAFWPLLRPAAASVEILAVMVMAHLFASVVMVGWLYARRGRLGMDERAAPLPWAEMVLVAAPLFTAAHLVRRFAGGAASWGTGADIAAILSAAVVAALAGLALSPGARAALLGRRAQVQGNL